MVVILHFPAYPIHSLQLSVLRCVLEAWPFRKHLPCPLACQGPVWLGQWNSPTAGGGKAQGERTGTYLLFSDCSGLPAVSASFLVDSFLVSY